MAAPVKLGKGRGGTSGYQVVKTNVMRKGASVNFFLDVDASDKAALLVKIPVPGPGRAMKLLQSHGWLEGTLATDFDPSSTIDAATSSTWPLVRPRSDISFTDRSGNANPEADTRRALKVREPSTQQPLLSLVFVRWGGKVRDPDQDEPNDGDWGQFGSPPSDEYMKAVIEKGILCHPRLKNDNGQPFSVEVLHLFVKSSRDVADLATAAPRIAQLLKGKVKTMWWMLWPAEWEDFGSPDYACYIDRTMLFNSMRACEAVGLSSGFPHAGDQFEFITSKTWMATLSLHPGARLPACCLVAKQSVQNDPHRAAVQALQALEQIRRVNPFVTDASDPPAPSAANKDGITKGVVKVGYSWENRFVSVFRNVEELKGCLMEMLNQPGCRTSQCVVQEWVDFDFEMRLYVLPRGNWTPGEVLKPERVECNAWGPRSEGEGQLGQSHASFTKLSHEKAIEKWNGDAAAFADAQAKAAHTSQLLLALLLASNARPPAMIRLDFMVKHIGAGKARVVFGEYCEMGACCLGWKEGPPTIWEAALDATLP